MKLWNQHTHRARKFYRLNHGNMSKDLFFLTYYRILHTAYLQQQECYIPVIKDMFHEVFKKEPNAWSLYYMMDTESVFFNDSVIQNLHQSCSFTDMDILQALFIEIGADVYLLQCMEQNAKFSIKSFYQWLPMKKTHKLKKLVKQFWKERLPKKKLLQQLYEELKPYAFEIRSLYQKLLLENDVLITMTPQRAVVLEALNTSLNTVDDVPADVIVPEVADLIAVTQCEDEEGMPEKTVDTVEPIVTEVSKPEPNIKLTTPLERPVVPVKKTVKVSQRPVLPERCGFSEKNNISKKKAVTCAVCVAAAGALLLPFVAYSVMKHQ